MSIFAVELKKISKIYPHTNADKLELGQVEGMTYQFAVQKGLYKVGGEVVYFPIDSVLPQELIQQQNIANFMAGKDKNRIKTCRLRGELSQGYVAPVESIKQFLKVGSLPEDLTSALGVIKYEAPEIMTQTGKLVDPPELIYYYDIESCDRFPVIAEKLMDQKVVITEKLEGSNMSVAVDTDKKIHVCMHNKSIENVPGLDESTFWQIAKNENIVEAIKFIQTDLFPNSFITIRSELLGPGVQGNYYRLQKHTTRIFDIDVNGTPLDFEPLMAILIKTGLNDKFVPIIAQDITLRDWLNGRTLQLASNGKSMLVDRIREGIVIKPMVEHYEIGFGRLFLKQRDPIYLDKTGL